MPSSTNRRLRVQKVIRFNATGTSNGTWLACQPRLVLQIRTSYLPLNHTLATLHIKTIVDDVVSRSVGYGAKHKATVFLCGFRVRLYHSLNLIMATAPSASKFRETEFFNLFFSLSTCNLL
jgi:hypothetical protein